MAEGSQTKDSDVNIHAGSGTDLNNDKASPTSSGKPLAGPVVHNETDGGKPKKEKRWKCSNYEECKTKTTKRYQGTKFICHRTIPQDRKKHNKLCHDCGKYRHKCSECPFHGEKYDTAAMRAGERDKTPPIAGPGDVDD